MEILNGPVRHTQITMQVLRSSLVEPDLSSLECMIDHDRPSLLLPPTQNVTAPSMSR
jgi:hypothetical protein